MLSIFIEQELCLNPNKIQINNRFWKTCYIYKYIVLINRFSLLMALTFSGTLVPGLVEYWSVFTGSSSVDPSLSNLLKLSSQKWSETPRQMSSGKSSKQFNSFYRSNVFCHRQIAFLQLKDLLNWRIIVLKFREEY